MVIRNKLDRIKREYDVGIEDEVKELRNFLLNSYKKDEVVLLRYIEYNNYCEEGTYRCMGENKLCLEGEMLLHFAFNITPYITYYSFTKEYTIDFSDDSVLIIIQSYTSFELE